MKLKIMIFYTNIKTTCIQFMFMSETSVLTILYYAQLSIELNVDRKVILTEINVKINKVESLTTIRHHIK